MFYSFQMCTVHGRAYIVLYYNSLGRCVKAMYAQNSAPHMMQPTNYYYFPFVLLTKSNNFYCFLSNEFE